MRGIGAQATTAGCTAIVVGYMVIGVGCTATVAGCMFVGCIVHLDGCVLGLRVEGHTQYRPMAGQRVGDATSRSVGILCKPGTTLTKECESEYI